jgi:transmembrane sensor
VTERTAPAVDAIPLALGVPPSPWLAAFAASQRDLLRFLRRRTGCGETARDLVQDAWLRVAERRAGSDTVVPATADHQRAYLFTVAERLAIDHLRRQSHWAGELAPRLTAGPAYTPDVAESHAHAQALRAVERALAGLPERTRTVFLGHRLDGTPHEELAQRFGVSRKTIEREVTRAMDCAQRALESGQTSALDRPDAVSAAAGAGMPVRRGRRQAIGTLLGLAGLASSAGMAWQLWRELVPTWQTAHATPRGALARLPLPDGSTLTLDADSAVDVRLYGARREVRLHRGGAFFDVARDPDRPFVVLAGAARVTVLGTRFAVQAEPDGVEVSVESGRVAVEGLTAVPHAAPLVLTAGEAARVDNDSLARPLPARAAVPVAAWRDGWLELDHVPLGRVAHRLNRYRTGAPVRVEPAAASLPVLARVDIARSERWLQGLPALLPVTVQRDADGGMTVRLR